MPEPRDELNWENLSIPADLLTAITGYTDRRHRQLAKEGRFPPPVKGQYRALATLQGLFAWAAEQLRKKNDEEVQERKLLAKIKREQAQEELAAYRGEYIKKADIGPSLRNLSLNQRALLQRKLELEVAPRLAGLSTVEILEKIRAANDQVCAAFSEGIRPWMDSPPAKRDSTAKIAKTTKKKK